jgi:hypothetical protein
MFCTRLQIALVVLFVLLAGCRQERGTQFAHPGERYGLEGADFAVQLPPLESVRDDLLGLVVNMEGMEGILALIEGAVGLDFANLELLDEAGLDSAMPGLLFSYRGGFVAVVGLADTGRFERYLEELSKGEAWSFRRTLSEGVVLYDQGRFALALEGNLLTLFWGPDGAALGVLAALLLEPKPESVEPLPEDGYAVKLKGASGKLEGDLKEFYAQVGPLAGVVRATARFLDGCGVATGKLKLGDRVFFSATAKGCSMGPGAAPKLIPEQLVPEDTILLVQSRLPVESLWQAIPELARYLVADWWQELPGKRPEELQDLGELLGRFEGEIAIALLGLGADANLDTFFGSKDTLAPLFGIHWQVVLLLREGAALDEFFDLETMKKLLPQYKPRGLGAGDLLATEYCRPKTAQAAERCFTLVRQGQVMTVVTGLGEGDRLVRTIRGQRKALGESLFASQERGPLTVTLKTRRLVKDLISKGFPPYFLQILSSILEVRVVLGAGEGETTLSGEVVLR